MDDFVTISPARWLQSRSAILQSIAQRFGDDSSLIIRSSAWDEDLLPGVFAGALHSEAGVRSSDSNRLSLAITNVVASFSNGRTPSPLDRVMIQRFLSDAKLSGVLLTWDVWHNRSYYVINFDNHSGRTDSVTSGHTGETVRIVRTLPITKVPTPWRKILMLVRKVEKLFPEEALDIEFGVDSRDGIHIFQVRGLNAVVDKKRQRSTLRDARALSATVKVLLEPKLSFSPGASVLSDMADWNPAEMLGPRPSELDKSLYRFLITRSSWNRARASLGYTDVDPAELMVVVGDKPYIDVRVSLNSLTPNIIKAPTRLKLVNSALRTLIAHPDLHDKIEFELSFSCFDLTCTQRLATFVNAAELSDCEATEVHQRLLKFTNALVEKSKFIILQDLQKIRKLQSIQSRVTGKNEPIDKALRSAYERLVTCRDLGTIPFSRLARLAFIALSLLRSLLQTGVISWELHNACLSSLATVANDVHTSCLRLVRKQIALSTFLDNFGYLRPQTYDITSPRYDMINGEFWVGGNREQSSFVTTKLRFERYEVRKINDALSNAGLNCRAHELFAFIKSAIEAREHAKFIFSRDISDVLETVADVAQRLGITRNEIAAIPVDAIFAGSLHTKSPTDISSNWRAAINASSARTSHFATLAMPPVIWDPNQLLVVPYPETNPNFVTQKCIQAKVARITPTSGRKQAPKLDNAVVLLESADPGYDWVFARNPAGIVTKYGGAGSHMMIRCASFEIPAAIGCGELLFEKLARAGAVILDCAKGVVTPLM